MAISPKQPHTSFDAIRDFSLIAWVCGGFALAWSLVRTGLVLSALRKTSSPQPFVADSLARRTLGD